MSGLRHRHKGDRIEEHEVDIYLLGKEQAPIKAEVKGRKNGAGFMTLENWIGEYDALFLRKPPISIPSIQNSGAPSSMASANSIVRLAARFW